MTAGVQQRGTGVDLSLVLPCYNEQDHLESLLTEWVKGLETLTPRFEILVINDGSRDRSGRVLDRLRKEFPSLRVVHQLNGGAERAYRRGLELARGRYILQGECTGRYRFEDYRHLWEQRDSAVLLVGYRPHRDHRWWGAESLIHRVATFLFRIPFHEPALPLRLYHAAPLRELLQTLPRSRETLNLLMTLGFFLRHPQGVREVAVPERPRYGGKSRVTLAYSLGMTCLSIVEMLWLRTRRAHWGIFAPPSPTPIRP